MRDRQAAAIEGRSQVQCDDLVPLADREVLDRGDVLHPGIVDQDLNRPRPGHQRLDPVAPSQVRRNVASAQFLAKIRDQHTGEKIMPFPGAMRAPVKPPSDSGN